MAKILELDLENEERLCALGSALSSPARIQILKLLYHNSFNVAEIAEKLQIPLESVMVLGDNQNDLSMFRVAGFPVAMGNATEEIKAASRAVTLDNDRSGVGYAVEKYVLECAQDERGGRPHDL